MLLRQLLLQVTCLPAVVLDVTHVVHDVTHVMHDGCLLVY